MSSAVVRQCYVLSLNLLSGGGHVTLCGCVRFFLFVSLLYNNVCVIHIHANTQTVCCVWVCVCLCDLSLLLLLKRCGLSWQLTSRRGCLPPVKSNLSLVRLLIELDLQNTGVVPGEQTTWTLKTTSGCLLILLKASVLVLIWFTKGGQLGNRFCIELLWISSLWNNATSLCKLTPEESLVVGGIITLDYYLGSLWGRIVLFL